MTVHWEATRLHTGEAWTLRRCPTKLATTTRDFAAKAFMIADYGPQDVSTVSTKHLDMSSASTSLRGSGTSGRLSRRAKKVPPRSDGFRYIVTVSVPGFPIHVILPSIDQNPYYSTPGCRGVQVSARCNSWNSLTYSFVRRSACPAQRRAALQEKHGIRQPHLTRAPPSLPKGYFLYFHTNGPPSLRRSRPCGAVRFYMHSFRCSHEHATCG